MSQPETILHDDMERGAIKCASLIDLPGWLGISMVKAPKFTIRPRQSSVSTRSSILGQPLGVIDENVHDIGTFQTIAFDVAIHGCDFAVREPAIRLRSSSFVETIA
jgi:hypothetical protein